MLTRGSRLAITATGKLSLDTGRWPEFTPGHGPTLSNGARTVGLDGYETVYDLAVARDRVAALCEGTGSSMQLAVTNLALAPCEEHAVDAGFARVAITDACVALASRERVVTFPERRVLADRPLDLAASASQLAILDADGVRWFDAAGKPQTTTPLFAPSAIAVDPIDGGWLVALDGGVYQLRGPGDSPRLLAAVAEPVKKVRRSADTTYVLVGSVLRGITGDRVLDLYELDDNPWYWNDFDAGTTGLVLEGGTSLQPDPPGNRTKPKVRSARRR